MKMWKRGIVAAATLLGATAGQAATVAVSAVQADGLGSPVINDSSRTGYESDNSIYYFEEKTVGTTTSWFVTWNPVNAGGGAIDTAGPASIDFGSMGYNIDTVISNSAALDSSDATYGLVGHAYEPSGNAWRGMEANDTFSNTPTILTLTYLALNGAGIDQLRVLTTAVPLPAAAWLFASAVVGVGVVARRRKSAQESSAISA